MKLLKFNLRYHPPGIQLEYVQSGITKTKSIDLLYLTVSSDVDKIAHELCKNEKLLDINLVDQVKQCIIKLRKKLEDENPTDRNFYIYKTLQNHLLPLTNVSFNKTGNRCLTGSYDRTCKAWNIENGKDEQTFTGHKNVVYSVGYNYPSCDKIVTGSFDKSAKIWDSQTADCLATLCGHRAEVVAASFSPSGDLVATASMDTTAKVFHSATGQEVLSLVGHTAEVISLNFNTFENKQLITGSFDGTVSLWDIRLRDRVRVLDEHNAEVSNCIYNWNCQLIGSGSLDGSACVWDTRQYKCLAIIKKHNDEVLDIAFDWCGQRLATVSADCTARIHDVQTDFQELVVLSGHTDEISKVCFSPGGAYLLTASADSTARLWNSHTGQCTQILSGHRGEVFSCAFSYTGDTLVTASKDNTCRVWR